MQSTSIYDNRAPQGGGIYLGGGALNAFNSTLSSNTAGTTGGALYAAQGNVDLRFVTIANNSAPSGAAVHNVGATVRLLASIVSSPAGLANCSGAALTSNGGYNRIGDLSCALLSAVADDRQNVANILLDPLSDNGGPTLTHMPEPDANVVDIMPNFVCQSNLAGFDLFDQRGRIRPSPVSYTHLTLPTSDLV